MISFMITMMSLLMTLTVMAFFVKIYMKFMNFAFGAQIRSIGRSFKSIFKR